MFICQRSGQLSEPREKATHIIVSERPATYRDAHGNVIGSGPQIVKVETVRLAVVDPERAARIALSRKPLNMTFWSAMAAPHFEHARKCKKALDDCQHCKSNVEFFASLPLPVLSHLTEEKRWR
jgi:hypothetical protein